AGAAGFCIAGIQVVVDPGPDQRRVVEGVPELFLVAGRRRQQQEENEGQNSRGHSRYYTGGLFLLLRPPPGGMGGRFFRFSIFDFRFSVLGFRLQASIFLTTLPWTSVRRKSRPW